MLIDKLGNRLKEGDFVRILSVQSHWFVCCPKEAYEILHQACQKPVEVEYFDGENRATVILPSTVDIDGEYVSNSLTLNCDEVELVKI